MNCRLYNEDCFEGLSRLGDGSVDLVIADPPYGLGKDYGNDSDHLSGTAYVDFSRRWLEAVLPKLKPDASLYVFLSWQNSLEVFCLFKTRLIMLNEIIWDRRVPSMGGSTRRYSSVHDNIGFFARSRNHYFDIDSVRVPYDAATKKARSRSIFVGKKWLELGYNPKDLWSVSRLHRQDPERAEHPTQKPLELVRRMVLASCPPGGVVLDPFMGSGTTAVAAQSTGRSFAGFEINPEYFAGAAARVQPPADAGQATVAGNTRRRRAPATERLIAAD
ncbi:MAG: site-specific DNA-methyltransferase [Betaproteobacteria bacterium]|nr:site-specific DNA-methyltransferase [Betaproteobacteria bacterium]